MFESDAACDDVKTYRNKVFPFEQGLKKVFPCINTRLFSNT